MKQKCTKNHDEGRETSKNIELENASNGGSAHPCHFTVEDAHICKTRNGNRIKNRTVSSTLGPGGGYEQKHDISVLLNIKLTLPKIATVISPYLNVLINFKARTKQWPDLKEPKSFIEKLCWLKLNDYNHNELVKQCADKYRVRAYVKERLGDDGESILNTLIAVYNRPEEIIWDLLPDSFAIKWNFGSGLNYIVHDKSQIDTKYVVERLRHWGKQRVWMLNAELQYRGVKKVLLIEQYLADEQGKLPEDYKVYCFNGWVAGILVIGERESGFLRSAFFDPNWNYVGKPHDIGDSSRPFEKLPAKPKSLEKMIYYSEKLSDGFPFVRIDYYEINGKLLFGEMTFTPAGCIDVHEIDINGKTMGELLVLDKGKK